MFQFMFITKILSKEINLLINPGNDVKYFKNCFSHFVQSRGTIKKREYKKILTHHLYFCMRDFGHHIGEDTEIYFSLYDAKKQKYISERFLVRISKEGFSNYVEKLHSNCTIFTVSKKRDCCIVLIKMILLGFRK